MRGTLIGRVLLFALLLTIVTGQGVFELSPRQGYAISEVDKVNKEIEAIKRQKREAEWKAKRAQSQLKVVKSQKREAKEDLVEVVDQIDDTSTKLNQLDNKIETVDEKLKEEVDKLETTENQMFAREEILKKRVNYMYKNGMVSYMEVLVDSTNFSDFIDRYISIQAIVKQDQELFEQIRSDRDEIAAQKVQIEEHLGQLKDLYSETDVLRDKLYKKEQQKEVMIASLDKMEDHLLEISEEQEQQLIDLAKKEAELIRKKKQYELKYTGGKMGWPVPGHFTISSGYGYRTHPVTGEKRKMHNGVDISAPGGTTIVAAEDGVVIVAQWSNGYGNTVILDHGSNTWTLYGHIRNGGIKVKPGEKVKRGEKIAEVGSTGRSTGNHLHFEVRVNEKAQNPMGYLK